MHLDIERHADGTAYVIDLNPMRRDALNGLEAVLAICKTVQAARTIIRTLKEAARGSRSSRREDLEARLMWDQSGMGFRLCTPGSMYVAALQKPKQPRGEDDLQSIVAVWGPPDKYTSEELELLVAFSCEQTASYDSSWGYRVGANIICVDKLRDHCWLSKRQSWNSEPKCSRTLLEALAAVAAGEHRVIACLP